MSVKVNWSTWHELGAKKNWVPNRNRTMISRTPGRRSIHWATKTHWEQGHLTEFKNVTGVLHTPRISSVEVMVSSDPLLRFFLYSSLVSCWSTHLSHFITEPKIHHLYSLNISFVVLNQDRLPNTNCKQTQSSLLMKSTCQDDFLFTQRIISSLLMTDSYAHKSSYLSQRRSFKLNSSSVRAKVFQVK